MIGYSRFWILGALTLVLLVELGCRSAGKRYAWPDFDVRRQATVQPQVSVAAETLALRPTKAATPDVKIDYDRRLGTAGFVRSERGLLSAPEPNPDRWPSLPSGAAPPRKVDKSDPYRALRSYLAENSSLLGYGSQALAFARVKREFTTPHNRIRTVVWQQEVGGLEIFEATLTAQFGPGDSLISFSPRFLPDPALARRTEVQRISAADALARAARNIGETRAKAPDFISAPGSTENNRKLTGRRILGEAEPRLVWFPQDRNTLKLCWRVVLTGATNKRLFLVLIDAGSGKVLLRRNWSHDAVDASYLVFRKDSPTPQLPGWLDPTSDQPAVMPQETVNPPTVSSNASPDGWVNTRLNRFGLTNTTIGNNLDAHLDWYGKYPSYGASVTPPRPHGTADPSQPPDVPEAPPALTSAAPGTGGGKVFFTGPNFVADLSQSPTNSTTPNAAVVSAFYWCNWFHDVLYDLGFDEAAGNFQRDNFGRGGVGGDALQVHVQSFALTLRGEGGATPSASPEDGVPSSLQLLPFSRAVPARDGSFDSTLMFHEYIHLMVTRLVGAGTGPAGNYAPSLAEGWADFYPMALLSDPAADPNGTYQFAAYVGFHFLLSSFEDNYYFGIRPYPISSDISKDPLTFRDIISYPEAAPDRYPDVPLSPLYILPAGPYRFDEAHAFGQVWCSALWDARANLIRKLGPEEGNRVMMQAVTDGMKLGPGDLTFLQARDALLLGERLKTGGRNAMELWAGFARRGMGYNATNSTSDVLQEFWQVRESFSVPPVLETGGAIYSSPGVGPTGAIYVGSGNKLLAIGPGGTNLWEFGGLTKNFAFNSSPAIALDGTIYIGCADSNLYAVTCTGNLAWRTNLGGGIISSPAIGTDGTIYIGASNGWFFAANPAGDIKWKQDLGSAVISSPALGLDGTIYVGTMAGQICALRPEDGSAAPGWPVTTGGAFYSSPAIGADGCIYVGSLDNRVYSFTPAGSQKAGWPFETAGPVYSSPVAGPNNTVFVGSSDGRLYSLTTDGGLRWTYQTKSNIWCTPAVARDGTVFVGSHDGRFYALNADGTERCIYPVGAPVVSSPMIDPAGNVWFGTLDGNLYAVPGQEGFGAGPWSMFRQNPFHTANIKTLRLKAGQPTGIGGFPLEISGPAGTSCEVLETDDLQTWTPVGTVLLETGTASLEVYAATGFRFFRARFLD
jgi:outer membrane protein assembly factor BamB